MERVDLNKAFGIPESYKPPNDNDLRTSTEYPNLNSKEYRLKPIDQTTKLYNFYETLIKNTLNNYILVCNDYSGRLWRGSLWGFDNINDVAIEKKSAFRLQAASAITNIIYIGTNTLLISEANGTLQLWSTKSDLSNNKGYCLFMVGMQAEHAGIITSLDVFANGCERAVSGANDGCIKLWDINKLELYSTNTFNYAHSDEITGVSVVKNNDPTFVSCSRDKSALLWDIRTSRPATCVYENHSNPFTAIYWTHMQEKCEEILIGDETGNINIVDKRKPNSFLNVIKVFDRPIYKIQSNGNKFAVSGNTNQFKIFNIENTRVTQLMENSDSKNYIRDFLWENDSCLYVVGWNKYIKKIML